MVNKQEAIGIFLSIAFMALVLAFFRFQNIGDFAANEEVSGNHPAAVVVATSDEKELASALSDAAGITGEMERLIIDDIRAGAGTAVKKGDTVTVDYVGTTQNGFTFDSSYEKGQPFTFTVGEGDVIEGWDLGIVGMKEGGQRILVIPADMAYGNAQVGPIPPNSVLVFSIELVSIK